MIQDTARSHSPTPDNTMTQDASPCDGDASVCRTDDAATVGETSPSAPGTLYFADDRLVLTYNGGHCADGRSYQAVITFVCSLEVGAPR